MKALPFLTLKVCVINNRVHTIPIEFGTTLDEAVALAVSIAPKWVQKSNLEICFDPAGRLSGATPPTRIFISAMVSADGAVRWPFPSPFVTSERFSQLETVSYSSGTKIVYICGFYLTARHLAEIGGYTCTSPPSHHSDVNVLSTDFCEFHGVRVWRDYAKRRKCILVESPRCGTGFCGKIYC